MQYIIRGLLVIALLGICVATFSYVRGGFEIPFIHRPPQTEVETPELTTTPDDTSIETTQEVTNLNNVMDPEQLTTQTTTSAEQAQQLSREKRLIELKRIFEPFGDTSELLGQGYAISDLPYVKYDGDKIQRAIDDYASMRERKYAEELALARDPSKFVFTEPEKPRLLQYAWAIAAPKVELENKRSVTYADINTAVSYLEPKFGYIFQYTAEGYNLLDADTSPLFTVSRQSELEFASARDRMDRPVFLREGSYYYYDRESDQFVPTEYDPVGDSRGVSYNYPSYFGRAGDSGLQRATNGKYYGFDTLDGTTAIPYKWKMTYNFSEGIGVGITADDKLQFIDTTGKSLNNKYYPPEVKGTSALGYFYFDHGLTRVLEIRYTNTRYVESKTELLVYKDFTPYELPKDYKLVSYSDGILLLEKNGLYGYMNYAGDWIAQPIYPYARPFCEGVGVLGLSNNKKAMIDTEGDMIVPFEFDYISQPGGGVVTMYDKLTGWYVLNKVSREIEY